MTLLSLGFSVALGQRLAAALLDRAMLGVPVALPDWTLAITLPLIAAALVVLFRARTSDFPWILATCTLAFLGTRKGMGWLGPPFRVGLGAFVLGLASNAFRGWKERPSIVTLLPGLVMPVPGGLGLQGLGIIIQKQLVAGLDTAFQPLFEAITAQGLLLA